MLAKVTCYEELASVFSNHVLTLDVTVEATDTWQVLAQCSQLFAAHNTRLLKISHGSVDILTFRLKCEHHSDISGLEAAFQTPHTPKKLSWSVTIGRRK